MYIAYTTQPARTLLFVLSFHLLPFAIDLSLLCYECVAYRLLMNAVCDCVIEFSVPCRVAVFREEKTSAVGLVSM